MKVPHLHRFVPTRREHFNIGDLDLNTVDAELAATLSDLLAEGPHTLTITTRHCTKCDAVKFTQTIVPIPALAQASA